MRACEELLDEGMLVLVHAAKACYRLGAKFVVLAGRCRRGGPKPRVNHKKGDSFIGKGSLRRNVTTAYLRPTVSFSIFSVPATSSVLIRMAVSLEAQKHNLVKVRILDKDLLAG